VNCRAIILLVVLMLPAHVARADRFVLQGSTTFNDCIMSNYLSAIEQATNHTLVVIPTKTNLGLIALLEGQADFAMISTRIENEIGTLRQTNPDLPFDLLQTFNVSRTRMAFAVNPANSVRSTNIDMMRRVLSGEITNWRDLGGPDLAIKLVFVRDGGGVQTSVENQVLDGIPIRAPNPIRVQVGAQVLKIVEQEPGALGMSQLNLVERSHAVELSTNITIEQKLGLVTLGAPTPQMLEVINAVKHIAKLYLK
jgi:phosphate transport system substrate-binding protein